MTSPMKNPSIEIYGLAFYDRGAKARWLLTEAGVPFESHWLSRERKEHELPEFRRLSPMGRVPVARVEDQVIFESGAICATLADLLPAAGLAPALESPDRPRYQQWMYFAASTLDVFQTRIMVIEDIPAGEIFDAKMSALIDDYRDALATLDHALAKSDFLVANRFSAADICVGYHLYWSTLWPELNEHLQAFPRLGAYLARLKTMPSAVEARVFSYAG